MIEAPPGRPPASTHNHPPDPGRALLVSPPSAAGGPVRLL